MTSLAQALPPAPTAASATTLGALPDAAALGFPRRLSLGVSGLYGFHPCLFLIVILRPAALSRALASSRASALGSGSVESRHLNLLSCAGSRSHGRAAGLRRERGMATCHALAG